MFFSHLAKELKVIWYPGRAIIKLHRYKISFSASLSHISLANEQLGVFSSQLIFMSLKQLVDYDNFN